jgi:virulence factor Mce-like protein
VQRLKRLANPMVYGVAALASITVVAVVAAMLYVTPPGQRTVAFYTTDASSVRPGDVVRIAGINVGKVRALSKEHDRVKVDTTVEDSAFVGDQSQVEVRMLTVVGGYYVNITSLGDNPLGDRVIPVQRVTMPYNLVQTLTDATKITDQVAPKPIRDSLGEIEQGLAGTNTETVSAVVDAGNSLVETLDRQRGQIAAILNLSDEYIETLANYKDGLKALVSKVAVLEQTLVLYGEGFAAALQALGDVGDSLYALGPFYDAHRERFIEMIRNSQQIFRSWADRSGLVVRGLRKVRNKLDRVLDAQNARPELLATDLCMPMPGSPC